jgi:hypothetical protein
MARSRVSTLVERSLEASLAAIEIYNKPNFGYREEAFSILMLNAWELLLKARVMRENGGSIRAIELWEPRTREDGTRTQRLFPRRNRSANKMTIGLERAIALVRNFPSDSVDDRCIENLNLLTEIRDNAVHLFNIDPGLCQRIQEVGSAALRNYAHAIESWFGIDLSRFNFFLMPLAFHSPAEIVEALRAQNRPLANRNLIELIANSERVHPSDDQRPYNVTIRIGLRFMRSGGQEDVRVRIVRDPTAPGVQVREEDIRQAYPWDYKELSDRLRERYSDFLQNQKYHRIRRQLERDDRLSRVRYLDPSNPVRSISKRYYSPNIVGGFDPHYSRR